MYPRICQPDDHPVQRARHQADAQVPDSGAALRSSDRPARQGHGTLPLQASRIVQEIDIDVCEEAFQELGGLTPGSKMNELIGSMADLILRYNFELEQAGMGPIQGFNGNLKLN